MEACGLRGLEYFNKGRDAVVFFHGINF
jgi:hypothetical protein